MNIREEFEKAFDETPASAWTPKAMALWAAQWMAEKCAKLSEESWCSDCYTEGGCEDPKDGFDYQEAANRIRQLAKELQ